MRKIIEVLRMNSLGYSNRQISQSCKMGRSTVADYLLRFRNSGLSWPLPTDLTESRLEERLFPPPSEEAADSNTPDWFVVHRELSRKGVTLALLWEEYISQNPTGRHYNWFCKKYRQWAKHTDPVMRQTHKAGEKLFVDYSGQTVEITDPATGNKSKAEIFVAVLGASNYTYAEATASQNLRDWIGSHTRAMEFFGGVPRVIVPDNLKSGVTRACHYEPGVNPAYQDWAGHYGAVVIPARVRAPRDKAKVENGVLQVERWILARLRNHDFFSLNELNRQIDKLVEALNRKPFQKMNGSRLSLFQEIESKELGPLPTEDFSFYTWKQTKVGIDYHVEVEGHYYSVPFKYVGKQVDIRINDNIIECLHDGERISSHIRSFERGRHTTIQEHMPPTHKFVNSWSPERFISWAEKVGPMTREFAVSLLSEREYPEQAYRSLLGVMRLSKGYSAQRFEAACKRALRINGLSYRSLDSILKNGLDSRPLPEPVTDMEIKTGHENIRGPEYFRSAVQTDPNNYMTPKCPVNCQSSQPGQKGGLN